MNLENKKLHVCLINYEYPSETSIGGIGTYQKRIADALYKKGCKVTVIAGSLEEDKEYYEDGIHVYRIVKKFPFKTINDYISYPVKLSKKIIDINKKEKIDVIESPEICSELIKYQEIRNIPIVTKLHTSYTIIRKYNIGFNTFSKNIEDLIINDENILINSSDKVISCSNLLKELVQKYHNIDLQKQIEVVPNPADIENFYPTKDNHNSKIILYCGSIERRKGVFELIKAIPKVLDNLKDEEIIFRFIGNYSNIENNGKNVKENLLNALDKKYHKYVQFLGKIENKQLNKYYNEARIGVIPSLFDNLPYVAMEELLTELPVIASNNTGIKEMIENEASGLLYDPLDYEELAKNIIYLYKNPEKAREYGKKGRQEILQKYSPEIIAERMINIYKETINEFREKYK